MNSQDILIPIKKRKITCVQNPEPQPIPDPALNPPLPNPTAFPPPYLGPCPALRRALADRHIPLENFHHVLQKVVTSTDLVQSQNRLQLPKQLLDDSFYGLLNHQESQLMRSSQGLEVRTVGRNGKDCFLTLGFIDQSNGSSKGLKAKKGLYRIRGKGYWTFVTENKFRVHQRVDVWLGRDQSDELVMLLVNFGEVVERMMITDREAARILFDMRNGRRAS